MTPPHSGCGERKSRGRVAIASENGLSITLVLFQQTRTSDSCSFDHPHRNESRPASGTKDMPLVSFDSSLWLSFDSSSFAHKTRQESEQWRTTTFSPSPKLGLTRRECRAGNNQASRSLVTFGQWFALYDSRHMIRVIRSEVKPIRLSGILWNISNIYLNFNQSDACVQLFQWLLKP